MRFVRGICLSVLAAGGTVTLAPVPAAAASPSPAVVSPTPVPCGSTSTISVSPQTSGIAAGASVPFAIQVTRAQGFGTWGGTVEVLDNGTPIAGVTLPAWNAASPNTLKTSWSGGLFATLGNHALTFDYSNTLNCPSGSSTSATVVVVGLSAPASSLNPSGQGNTVTFTSHLLGAAGTPYAAMSGTVTFLDGSRAAGTAPLVSGTASLSTASLGPGSHTITATMPAPSFGIVQSAGLVQVVNAPVSTPSPTAPPPAPPTAPPATAPPVAAPPAATALPATPAPASASATPASTSTPVPVSALSGVAPPGAASGASVAALGLQVKEIPLTGGQGGSLSPGLLDVARVPSFRPLGNLAALDFGQALTIWPVLVGIIVFCLIAMYLVRRRWLADDREFEALARGEGARSAPA